MHPCLHSFEPLAKPQTLMILPPMILPSFVQTGVKTGGGRIMLSFARASQSSKFKKTPRAKFQKGWGRVVRRCSARWLLDFLIGEAMAKLPPGFQNDSVPMIL